MTLSLAVTDNGNATATATVTGSAAGSTNNVYYASLSYITGVQVWALGGTVTGDGSVTITPTAGAGAYIWNLLNTAAGVTTQAPAVVQALADSATAVHYSCLTAVQGRIQGLGLSGIGNTNINVKWLPRDWQSIDDNFLPGVLVAPVGRETQPGSLTGMDDIGYPVTVAIVEANNQGYTLDLARNLLWRQKIFRALRHFRFAAVQPVITLDVQPGWVVDPEAFDRNRFVSMLQLSCRSREPRGA